MQSFARDLRFGFRNLIKTPSFTSQRTNEIGIRMALGARAADVLSLVVRQGLSLVAIGLVLGVVGALAAARLMTGLLFGVRANDPVTLVAVTLFLGIVALLASYLPARRRSRR